MLKPFETREEATRYGNPWVISVEQALHDYSDVVVEETTGWLVVYTGEMHTMFGFKTVVSLFDRENAQQHATPRAA